MRKMSPWSSVAGRIPCTGLPRLNLLQLWDLPLLRISESNASSVVPDEDWMDVFTAPWSELNPHIIHVGLSTSFQGNVSKKV